MHEDGTAPRVALRLPAPVLDKADRLAAREERTRSKMLAILVREALEARERAVTSAG